jgi:hypothetical protein
LLATDDEGIVPSPSLAARAMTAVLEDAASPPRISFPWKHAAPGFVAAVLCELGLFWATAVFVAGLLAVSLRLVHGGAPGLPSAMRDEGRFRR